MECKKRRSPEHLFPRMYNNCHCISSRKRKCNVTLGVLMFRNFRGKIVIQKAVVEKCGRIKVNQTIFMEKEKEFLLSRHHEYRKQSYTKLSRNWINNIHIGLRKMFDDHLYLRFGR
uniref:Ribosomal protein S4 n=1 Tax=Parastrongyloides trichosuri TaxID=131310 RepID=A0A0N4ZFT8_PARTI